MNKSGLLFGIVFVSLIFVFGCSVDKEVKDTKSMYKQLDFFKGDLSLNTLPMLNKEVELSFTFSRELINQVGSSNPLVILDIPSKISINGYTKWEDVENTEVTTRIIVTSIGEYKIKAYIETIFPAKHKESREHFLCFKTTENSAEILPDCSSLVTLEVDAKRIE